ncbi:uncharacterized protein LOC119112265 isoform X1 [Pollicipes pollicipes]|uniref:uncharacterized protein LOC119112265 isoform X1 n=1 Tax=Pollicipes pollicipes TaxID=41117 RepID=UPI001884D8DE|nr:uncharacterized protein LOC119112265 isoform X1 [Pollicipes pollicipes]
MLPDVTSQTPQAQAPSPPGDLLAEIRSLLHEKLTEIHESLNARMESLENEMKERDRILQEICSRQQCQELTPASSETASSPDSTSDQTCFTEDMQPDELWKLEFMNRSRDHTVVDVGLSDSDQAASDASASAGGQPNDWEVQMLVAEMDRSERQQRRSLVPDLTFSELELLGRLEGGRPARSTVGRMASMDAVHVAGQAERCRLGRNASLRESSSSRRRPLRKRELVTTMSDTAGASFNNSRAQHRPLLQGVNGDSSRDSSPATKGRASGSNPSQVVESVAL